MASVSQASSVGSQVRSHGFAVVDSVLDAGTVAYFGRLVDDARSKSQSAEAVTNSSGTYGLRNLTDVIPEVADLVRHPQVCRLVTDIAGDGAFMVRATLFDKTPGANWGVFWHQDLSIAVASRHDVAGFTSWTRKAGVDCTQPPVAIMEQLPRCGCISTTARRAMGVEGSSGNASAAAAVAGTVGCRTGRRERKSSAKSRPAVSC
ncbi:MAG: hypothetical protein R3C19_11040 [Planctomycetaceae bacterium]